MKPNDLTLEDLHILRGRIHKLPVAIQMQTLEMLEELVKRRSAETSQNSILSYGKEVYPNFIIGAHHRKIAKVFEAVARGEKKRVIINIAPRFGKSVLSSILLPSWYMGKFPDKKIIMASHTADLSVDFGRKVRDIILEPNYQRVFPGVELKADSKAAGKWQTDKGGEYYAVGVGGALAGRGGDLIVIDDPHSEQEAKMGDPEVFLKAWEWFQSGPLQRLMPGGAIVLLMTRWSALDLTGQIINHMTKNPDADQWELIEFPAILNANTDNEKSLWPEFWPLEQLKAKQAGLDTRYWSAQYMQNPTSEGAALIKREWWKHWDKPDPPDVDYIIMSLDAAQESHNRADYNALTVWGIFQIENAKGEMQNNIILLDAWKRRMEFPELKKVMFEEYQKWEPDNCIIEKKSNGAALLQEMRAAGIPISEFVPGKGTDKIARVNSVSDIFSSGMVWAPTDRNFAKDVIEECASFPLGANDDLTDSTTQAIIRFRKGGFITLPSDTTDDEFYRPRRTAKYY
jgi:predicted phage terminase large subunit-like protein